MADQQLAIRAIICTTLRISNFSKMVDEKWSEVINSNVLHEIYEPMPKF